MLSRSQLLFDEIMTGDRVANLERMVVEKRVESEFLDFKRFDRNPAGTKGTWSKALSGFANTEGGVLVFGIDARKHEVNGIRIDAASEAMPFEGAAALVETLRAFHREATVEPVLGVEIVNIDCPDGRGFVVCHVPEGKNKPYRDEVEKKYWQRVQDAFQPISHALLRSLFYPVRRASFSVLPQFDPSNSTVHLSMRNVGTATAEMLSVFCKYDERTIRVGTDTIFRKRRDRRILRTQFMRVHNASLHPSQKMGLESLMVTPPEVSEVDDLEMCLVVYCRDHAPQCFSVVLPMRQLPPSQVITDHFIVTEIDHDDYEDF